MTKLPVTGKCPRCGKRYNTIRYTLLVRRSKTVTYYVLPDKVNVTIIHDDESTCTISDLEEALRMLIVETYEDVVNVLRFCVREVRAHRMDMYRICSRLLLKCAYIIHRLTKKEYVKLLSVVRTGGICNQLLRNMPAMFLEALLSKAYTLLMEDIEKEEKTVGSPQASSRQPRAENVLVIGEELLTRYTTPCGSIHRKCVVCGEKLLTDLAQVAKHFREKHPHIYGEVAKKVNG